MTRHLLFIAIACVAATASAQPPAAVPSAIQLGALQQSAVESDPRFRELRLYEAQADLRLANIASEWKPAVSIDGLLQYQSDVPTPPPFLPGGTPLPVYVAAMGPKALRVTGELADGTLPYLAGPRTVAEFIAPTITKAAADAGRPAPRIVAAVPVLVTDDVDAGRAAAADTLGFYATIPSYQMVIAREGAESVADLAAVGPADVVRAQLQRYRDAGATDLVLSPLRGVEGDPQRIWEVAASL